jgi:drug/metabolite transporter (DMT)-like permease
LKTSINILWLAFPAVFDSIGCTLMYVALTNCAASVYQMMRGIIVVMTAFLSVTFLKRKQYAHHWLSLFSIVAGVAIVGVCGISAGTNDDGESVTSVSGIILLLGSQIFISLQLVTEEKILEGYYLDPFFLVGIEGFWGLVFFTVFLPIFQHLKIDGKVMEDSVSAFSEMSENPQLIIEAVCIVFSIGAFNVCGIAVTKYASAA